MIDRKTLRDFMQNVMREKLFSSPEYSRDDVCKFFENFTGRMMSLEDKIELMQTLRNIYISNTNAHYHTLYFTLDPVEIKDWDATINDLSGGAVMSEKFTHGKWICTISNGAAFIDVKDKCRLASINSYNVPEWEANAQLMAHAKDMYNLLLKCVDRLTGSAHFSGLALECLDMLKRIDGEEA